MSQPAPSKPKAPLWLQVIGIIIGFSAVFTFCSYAGRTPAQKAIDDCYESARSAVKDSVAKVDYGALRKQCQFECVSGQLDGCKK